MDESSNRNSRILQELDYYKKQIDLMSGESIQSDFVISSLRHELKQKKEAFSILTTLQRDFTVTTPIHIIFDKTVKAINAQLGMDHSIVLTPTMASNVFKANHWYGFQEEQVPMLELGELEISPNSYKSGQYILHNKTVESNGISDRIQKTFFLNYFVGVPMLLEGNAIGFILAGRKYEKPPFVPALNESDADTLMAIAGLIGMVIQNKKMMELRLQKAEVEKQREAIAEQRDKLEQTLNELRKAQLQLVQREKMASLGELTAGIAHEIQNPLNFVNNFSEVNTELIEELKEELKRGIRDIKIEFEILNDIKRNEEKINHHGKRADSIVKGMLQHSQSSTSNKEPTEINKLANEYLHLAYHGFRAKDKSFNVTMQTDFNENVNSINIIPQDIGRVLLNLYNNAFYAISEKNRGQLEGYEPTISVSTKRIDDKVWITVKDNGNGISPKVIDKIFQPFFTTKPTGQGTGLGLSLSYDILKAHGGEIKVEAKDGEGAEFIVQIPID